MGLKQRFSEEENGLECGFVHSLNFNGYCYSQEVTFHVKVSFSKSLCHWVRVYHHFLLVSYKA